MADDFMTEFPAALRHFHDVNADAMKDFEELNAQLKAVMKRMRERAERTQGGIMSDSQIRLAFVAEINNLCAQLQNALGQALYQAAANTMEASRAARVVSIATGKTIN